MTPELKLSRLKLAVYANSLSKAVIKSLNGGMLCVPNLKVLDWIVRDFFRTAPSRFRLEELKEDVLNGTSIFIQNVPSILSRASQKRLTIKMDIDKTVCKCGYCCPKARQLLAAEVVVILAHKDCYFDIDAWQKPHGQDHATLIRNRWKVLSMRKTMFDINPVDYSECDTYKENEEIFERREDSMGVD